jgi:hypothetical protein
MARPGQWHADARPDFSGQAWTPAPRAPVSSFFPHGSVLLGELSLVIAPCWRYTDIIGIINLAQKTLGKEQWRCITRIAHKRASQEYKLHTPVGFTLVEHSPRPYRGMGRANTPVIVAGVGRSDEATRKTEPSGVQQEADDDTAAVDGQGIGEPHWQPRCISGR